ncbi:TIGR02452 family protein [Paenibacillus donghaensis]|uniref:TIGR02452 family protein n=1 Tax=Paenibacillus donghaensis TaxID=414771 RepID=A0A2Z2KUY8_9BACL|nr:TIGR02452 family protein [Paenibacillus donghaensis]ASA24951.1 TIGR02452 family protein [Paenibacillus donghaensis]
MNNKNRKEIAQDTLRYMNEGKYLYQGSWVDFSSAQQTSEDQSETITPEKGLQLLARFRAEAGAAKLRMEMQAERGAGQDEIGSAQNRLEQQAEVEVEQVLIGSESAQSRLESEPADVELSTASIRVAGEATVRTILDLAEAGTKQVGVLNFASAKNEGGGFLNGAMAQEESLAASSGLYATQLRNPDYYKTNRNTPSMMYTHYAIYSPDVVFFRDEHFELLAEPVTASVLTLPAVNYGQVLLKGEDAAQSKQIMQERMELALALFAASGDRHLVLGAYGCGVFRNNPLEVARWWKELLEQEGYGLLFEQIVFAVLDHSKTKETIRAFEDVFGTA